MRFPLLGLTRDFHPLDNAHAERTKKSTSHRPVHSSQSHQPHILIEKLYLFYQSCIKDKKIHSSSLSERNKDYVSCIICTPIALAIAVSTALYISVSFVSMETISEYFIILSTLRNFLSFHQPVLGNTTI